MLKAALFGHHWVPSDVLRRASDRAIFEIEKFYALWREHGNLAIAQKKDAARVLQNRGDVARDEKFVIAQADNDRRSHARRDNLLRIARGKRYEGIGSANGLDSFK